MPFFAVKIPVFAFLIVILVSRLTYAGDGLMVGVNQTDFPWLPPDVRASIITSLRKEGMPSMRVAVTDLNDVLIDSINQATASGINILININPNSPYFYGDMPGKTSVSEESWPLSSLPLTRFEHNLTAIFDRLQSRQIPIYAVEIGNEINWSDFNSDLSIGPGPDYDVLSEASSSPRAKQFVAGLRVYMQALRIVKKLRAEGHIDPNAIILGGALAIVNRPYALHVRSEFADELKTLALIRLFGADDVVDGYSAHYYLDSSDATPSGSPDRLQQFCAATGGKACWATEFGVPEPHSPCAECQELASSAIARVRQNPAVASVYIYDWFEKSSSSPFAVWRNGSLTDVGMAFLQSR